MADNSNGASTMVMAIVVIAVLVIGGFLLFNFAGGTRTAGGPSVNITTGTGGMGGK